MKKSKYMKCILIISLLIVPFQRLNAESLKAMTVMSFGEWKQHTKKDIQDRMINLQSKISDQKKLSKSFTEHDNNGSKNANLAADTAEPNLQKNDRLSSDLRNERMRLEASEDLTFHEYFISYLLIQKDFDKKIAVLAANLKPEEIRELITSYGDIVNKLKDEGKHGYNLLPLDD
jgi:small-conductance mechanosensitive channel